MHFLCLTSLQISVDCYSAREKKSSLSKCVKNRSRSEQYIKNLNSLIIIRTEKNALMNLYSDVVIDIAAETSQLFT
jgi:hypothetical protein